MSSSARDDVFGSIRRSLGVKGGEATRRQIVADRIERAPQGVIPGRGRGSPEDQVATFRMQAELAFATVAQVGSPAHVPGAIAEYLRSHNLPATLRMGDDPRLAAMPWAKTTLDISRGR